MAVRSMQQVLTHFAQAHLGVLVPDDVDCVFDIATVVRFSLCDEGHLHPDPGIRVNLWVQFPPDSSGSQIGPMSATETADANWLEDGDVEPLACILNEMWERLCFLSVMGPTLPDLYGVLAEAGISEEEVEVAHTSDGGCPAFRLKPNVIE